MFLNATLFAQITVFILFALFTMKYVWPPIVKALDERAAKISEGLAAAERGRQSLDLAAKRSADTLREGKDKAAGTIVDVAAGNADFETLVAAVKAQAASVRA